MGKGPCPANLGILEANYVVIIEVCDNLRVAEIVHLSSILQFLLWRCVHHV